jgi:hypothetical protein
VSQFKSSAVVVVLDVVVTVVVVEEVVVLVVYEEVALQTSVAVDASVTVLPVIKVLKLRMPPLVK